MDFKLQTRIKVVTIGENVQYIPQYRGFKKIGNQYKSLAYTVFLPFLIVHHLLEILIWDEIHNDYSISTGKQYSQQYAQKMINCFLDGQQELSNPKPKKTISYIKYS